MKIVKSCPDCGSPLVTRVNIRTKELFLGCSKYPECKHTEQLPEAAKMELLGAPKLFDTEGV